MQCPLLRIASAILATLLLVGPAATQDDLQVIFWNVESDGNDPATIAAQIAAFDGFDVWGLSEVRAENPGSYARAAADEPDGFDAEFVPGTTGGSDRLLLIDDAGRFERLQTIELIELSFDRTVRAPPGVRLRERDTGQKSLVMVNHLARGKAFKREGAAEGLREFAVDLDIPFICGGDCNLHRNIPTQGPGNRAFALITEGDHLRWLRPGTPIKTRASGIRSTSEIVVRPGDFPDDGTTSDHRPVSAVFALEESVGEEMTLEEMLGRIAGLEAELEELKQIVEGMRDP